MDNFLVLCFQFSPFGIFELHADWIVYSFSGFLSCHAELRFDGVGAGGLHYRGVIRRCSNFRGQGVGGVHFSYLVPNFPILSPSRGGFRGVGDAVVVKLIFQAVVSNFRLADVAV